MPKYIIDPAQAQLTSPRSYFGVGWKQPLLRREKTKAHFDFLLDRLEQEQDAATFGALAAALVNLHHIKASSEVYEIERVLPVWLDSEHPIRIINRWSLDRFGELIRPQLEQIALQDTGEQVMPAVLGVWTSRLN